MAQLELENLKLMVANAADLTSVSRQESERARDYYDGHQYTAAEIAELNRRKQPIVTANRIQRKVDAMVGLEQRMRVDPKALPRGPEDEEMAEAATKALVFVDDQTRFDNKRSQAFETMIVEGIGGVEIGVEHRRGQFEITIDRLRWEEIIYDPHSREKDFTDASYIGTQKWMSLDKAMALLTDVYQGEGDLADLLQTSMDSAATGETYDDRPNHQAAGYKWADKRQKRVRVAQLYYQSGGIWYLAYFVGGEVLYNEPSPYVDEDGQPACAIELMTAYIDRENRRYGVVKSMLSQQDEINKRRSKLLHQLTTRQTMVVKGSVADVETLRSELARPDGVVELDLEAFEDSLRAGVRPFEVLQQNDQIAGQFSLLQESKGEVDMIGPNPSLVGQTEAGASGRAIMAQQQAGMAELAPLYDSLRDWTVRVYRAIWSRIKQFWQEPRWVRVLDQAGAQAWVGLNQPQGYMQVLDMNGMPTLKPQIQNPVAEMDVDLIIEDVPDHVTLQQEQFEQLARLAQQGIPIPPEMLIKASAVQDKQEILELMKERMEAENQTQAQEAQMEMQGAEAKAQRDQAEATKTQVETMRLAMGR